MSNDGLINDLVSEGVIRHQDVGAAMRKVDRAAFCPKDLPNRYVYQDSPLPIGYGETISAPHMHATCLELLRKHLHDGSRALDVGSGSGYFTAAIGFMIKPSGKVIGIEKHPELVEYSIQRMRESYPGLLASGVVDIRSGNVLGDALDDLEEHFDAIHVGAAAAAVPDVLVQKLKPGGRMVIPVGAQWENQILQVVEKDEKGKIKKYNVTGVRYVPLTKPGED
jgi:protein-L-isoaspartate(D-aspartate) O-methyltransferase